jgi:hypothetical protein
VTWARNQASETSVDIQLKTRQYIPEDSELHTRRREILEVSHLEPFNRVFINTVYTEMGQAKINASRKTSSCYETFINPFLLYHTHSHINLALLNSCRPI